MKKWIMIAVLGSAINMPAMAIQHDEDIDMIFHKSTSPLGLAPLSTQEMQETSGQVIPVRVIVSVIGHGTLAGISYWNTAPNPNGGGLAVAVGLGIIGGLGGGFLGTGIITFGALAASQIGNGPTGGGCTAGRPCILPY